MGPQGQDCSRTSEIQSLGGVAKKRDSGGRKAVRMPGGFRTGELRDCTALCLALPGGCTRLHPQAPPTGHSPHKPGLEELKSVEKGVSHLGGTTKDRGFPSTTPRQCTPTLISPTSLPQTGSSSAPSAKHPPVSRFGSRDEGMRTEPKTLPASGNRDLLRLAPSLLCPLRHRESS